MTQEQFKRCAEMFAQVSKLEQKLSQTGKIISDVEFGLTVNIASHSGNLNLSGKIAELTMAYVRTLLNMEKDELETEIEEI